MGGKWRDRQGCREIFVFFPLLQHVAGMDVSTRQNVPEDGRVRYYRPVVSVSGLAHRQGAIQKLRSIEERAGEMQEQEQLKGESPERQRLR